MNSEVQGRAKRQRRQRRGTLGRAESDRTFRVTLLDVEIATSRRSRPSIDKVARSAKAAFWVALLLVFAIAGLLWCVAAQLGDGPFASAAPAHISGATKKLLVSFAVLVVSWTGVLFSTIGAWAMAYDRDTYRPIAARPRLGDSFVLAWLLLGIAVGGVLLIPLVGMVHPAYGMTDSLREFAQTCINFGGTGALFLNALYFGMAVLDSLKARHSGSSQSAENPATK